MEFLAENIPEVFFDFTLFSDITGCAKPSTEIYNIVHYMTFCENISIKSSL
jgi:FMN phosphatase YigB (HAD superfamily)